MAQRPSLNPREPLVEITRVPTRTFLTFMRDLNQAVEAAPSGFDPVALLGQTASIATTALPTDGDLSAGLYRVSWYLQVMTAAGVSSSAQVTISWTLNGVTQTKVGAANNGNLTTTSEANSVPLLAIDAASPISYAVNYASNPAAAMAFNLFLVLERMALLPTT